ncbi:uncharacterized protein LOC143878181 [Tasmannia lanceolata]|uniref:uncharacterized protein LOC143878181 n=1 Tax=Tasmannia lanceolata TaxID=3420 RepID=UPI004063CFA4
MALLQRALIALLTLACLSPQVLSRQPFHPLRGYVLQGRGRELLGDRSARAPPAPTAHTVTKRNPPEENPTENPPYGSCDDMENQPDEPCENPPPDCDGTQETPCENPPEEAENPPEGNCEDPPEETEYPPDVDCENPPARKKNIRHYRCYETETGEITCVSVPDEEDNPPDEPCEDTPPDMGK